MFTQLGLIWARGELCAVVWDIWHPGQGPSPQSTLVQAWWPRAAHRLRAMESYWGLQLPNITATSWDMAESWNTTLAPDRWAAMGDTAHFSPPGSPRDPGGTFSGPGTMAVNASSATPYSSVRDVTAKPWPLLKQPTSMVIILTLAYLVVFTFGVVNNSLVVAVIYRNPQLRTVTNYFLANLAIADILVSILVLPITLLSNLFSGQCSPLSRYTGLCTGGRAKSSTKLKVYDWSHLRLSVEIMNEPLDVTFTALLFCVML